MKAKRIAVTGFFGGIDPVIALSLHSRLSLTLWHGELLIRGQYVYDEFVFCDVDADESVFDYVPSPNLGEGRVGAKR